MLISPKIPFSKVASLLILISSLLSVRQTNSKYIIQKTSFLLSDPSRICSSTLGVLSKMLYSMLLSYQLIPSSRLILKDGLVILLLLLFCIVETARSLKLSEILMNETVIFNLIQHFSLNISIPYQIFHMENSGIPLGDLLLILRALKMKSIMIVLIFSMLQMAIVLALLNSSKLSPRAKICEKHSIPSSSLYHLTIMKVKHNKG